ncbi:PREDICTED: uncharacterized protein LOC105458165 [Wasmannia auropunctata]|uniref:uncharacterized protein LOC105458165 n=1 Tax=Wasmannia auropunctata TaxID=64793 RepID=UPI0005EDA68E|nr:PREDICTED: uncharacterized protein LOC105458165 [Wasmannia auropunctata]
MAYSLGLFEFASLVHDREKLVDFLIQHGVLSSAIKCHRCGNDVEINKETLSYKCGKRYLANDARKKRVSRQCSLKQTGTASWFRNSHLDMGTICRIIACFLMFPHPRQDNALDETGVSLPSLVHWFNFCREVCVIWTAEHSQKLGGPGRTVEIDEAKIGRRKYNYSRFIQSNWVFGGFERESKKIFIAPVQERTEQALLACIKE